MRHSLWLRDGAARPCSPESGEDQAIGDPRGILGDEGIVPQDGGKSPDCGDLGSCEATS